ncbi:MAG: hypothetical protein ABWX73_09785 [Marmoricola sp.]
MSDQTSPPGQPTPPPSEGVGSGADAADTTAAPPPPPPADTAVGQAPPPLPPKKSRTGLIVALIAGLIVLAIVAVVAVVLVVGKGEEKHSIAIPATAGGMKRDKDKETELKQQLDAAEKQFQTQAKNVSYVKSGVYDQNDTKRGPEGALVFLGAKLSKVQSPTQFVDSFGKQATTNGFKIDKISAGEGGGKAVCAYQSTGQKVAICAWATKDSMGELVPTVPGYDSKQLSKILLDMRPDIETTD